jgi:hypothetical protein
MTSLSIFKSYMLIDVMFGRPLITRVCKAVDPELCSEKSRREDWCMRKCLVHIHIRLSCWGFTGMSAQGLHAEDPQASVDVL